MRCKLVGAKGVSKGKEKIGIFLNFLTAFAVISHHPLALWFDKAMALGDLPLVSRVPPRLVEVHSPVQSGQVGPTKPRWHVVTGRWCQEEHVTFLCRPRAGWARTGTLTKTRADNT